MRRMIQPPIVLSLLTLLVLSSGCSSLKNAAPWHRIELAHEFSAKDLKNHPNGDYQWSDYLAQEEKVFNELTEKLAAEDTRAGYRYSADSQLNTLKQTPNWNRTFVLTPKKVRAGIVMLHGLTDSPYSVRSLAQRLEQQGFLVIAMRTPGHGTIPAGLLETKWEDWAAATRLAAQELKRQLGDNPNFYMLGYSNGGALALDYALDALQDPQLPQPKKIVLLSPMIGVSKFAGLTKPLDLLGHLPYMSSERWLSKIPEYNPFKYNSFPVNAGLQAHRLSRNIQKKIARAANTNALQHLPPVLTFQSLMDSTVKTAALKDYLYNYLPENHSELVLFDLNRYSEYTPIIKPGSVSFMTDTFPPEVRRYDLVTISNRTPTTEAVSEFRQPAGMLTIQERPLELSYPRGIFSLSHVAVPFPANDPTYGVEPKPEEFYGIRLGSLHLRGETNTLIIKADAGMRLYSNPFYPYMQERITQWLEVR